MTWEETFSSWSAGPGKTEQDRCDNAVSMISDAIKNDDDLKKLDIEVFPQGSYRARTNISRDSDVDICVMLKTTIFTYYPQGFSDELVGNSSSQYTYATFKNTVERALVKKFGQDQVKRGNKAFDVHANSYRVDADIVPTFQYRSYTGKKDLYGAYVYHTGVKLITDKGDHIVNWPDQTYENGVSRNNMTSRKYKRCIRILKNLRNRMQGENILDSSDVASFLIESLVWNAPVEAFSKYTFYDMMRYILAHTCNDTRTDEVCNEWGEVNELKYLFRPTQPWTRQKANSFLNAAWNYIGYK